MSGLGQDTYQSTLPMAAAGVAAIVFFLIGLSSAFNAPSIAGKSAYAIICFSTSAALFRCAQAKLVTTDEGVRVSNPWSRFELRWEEIDRFELGRWRINPAVCLVRQIDGEVRPVIGLAESNFRTGAVARDVEELNRELERRVPRPGSQALP